MKRQTILLPVMAAIATINLAIAVKADTVTARCSVYPKGEDRASWYGSCSFSQRQGFVGIQLANGQRYELSPTGQPDRYRDQKGRPAYRETEAGGRQYYRFTTESIIVTFDETSNGQGSGNSGSTALAAQPSAGTPVFRLNDLVGAKAGQAENAVKQRGYRFVKSSGEGNSVYSYWLEGRTNYCVTIRTTQGRYQSIVYAGGPFDCQN